MGKLSMASMIKSQPCRRLSTLSSEMVSTSASTSTSGLMPVKVSYADNTLSRPTVLDTVQNLPVQIAQLDRVAVDDTNLAKTGCSHVDGDD